MREENEKAIDEAWAATELPEVCYANQGSLSFLCPSEFPERAGQMCFKPCEPYHKPVNWEGSVPK